MKKDNEENLEDMIEEINDRSHLNIQEFMNDMQLLSDQLKNKNLIKPSFNFGDLGISNYLLWLCLGELMQLNDRLNEDA